MEQDDLQSVSSSTNISTEKPGESDTKGRKSKRLSQPANTITKKDPKETFEWKLGDFCESCDHTKSWYRCKIIQVEESRLKVHFCGWNSRYDKWLQKDSNEIRAEKKTTKTKSAETKEQMAAKDHNPLPNGTQIMAKWIDETFYPAKITRSLTKNHLPYYEVKFYDGIRKTVRFNHTRLPNGNELDEFGQNVTEEPKPEKIEEASKRRAEAELLLAIQEPVIMTPEEEVPKVEDQQPQETQPEARPIIQDKQDDKTEQMDQKDQNSARKSLRVKRLRTFTEEIVFDSPSSSIAYNLASMRKEKSPEPKRAQERKKLKTMSPMVSKTEASETDDERRKRKKNKKDKRKLFEELIRNSKMQLEKQQKLIAKQLEEHSLKKSQKKLQKMIKKHQELIDKEANMDDGGDLLPISCTFDNCTKTFRKQSLLDYHLKYHHYIHSPDLSQKAQKAPQPKRVVKQKKKKKDNFDVYSYGNSLKSDDEMDPYEVIHCKCSNNINKGFMIQCEVCLCWQHGDCENIRSNKQVPDNYLCWVCAEPANNLKNLKYQSWIKSRLDTERHADSAELNRLKLLNECSKQYYGLNLLMYTLEFQMSLFNQLMSKSKPHLDSVEQSVDVNNEVDYDDDTYDQLNRLSLNIAHLQDCIAKQFNEFDSKLDEYETSYPMDESIDMQNFNLEQLYKQLQSIV